jgi:beta-glucosidase
VNIGEEARYRDKDVLLGPGVNIYRTPLNGRNFEYMGEDPYLASRMVVPYVQGVQSNGVAACVKHFALNNQEVMRSNYNAVIDDRALYEIYLPAFKAAVTEGKAWAIMPSYNLYLNEHAAENKRLLEDILIGEWKFDGVSISDWGAVHNTRNTVLHGVDMEFGTWTDGMSFGATNAYQNYFLAQPYLNLIKEGVFGTKELDEKVRRVLRLMMRTGMNRSRGLGSMNSPAHAAAARAIAEAGIVLLKNKDNLLPIQPEAGKTLLVVGENAIKMMTVGGGSSSLKARYEISPLQGMQERLKASGMKVVYARGYVGDVGGTFDGVKSGQNLADTRTPEELTAEAVRLAKEADYVLFVGGLNKAEHQDCEGADRTTLSLPYGQDELITALAAANPKLIVLNISGNAVAMPWVNEVPAVVQGWYLGSEAGHALASVLTGGVNPSGKLPFTFPVKLTDIGAHAVGDYPGVLSKDTVDVVYREGIFVGYRWTDSKKIKTLFPFGHGLSYTTFAYSDIKADKKSLSSTNPNDKLTLSVTVTNTGSRAGDEIVQLYITDRKSLLPRPVKELKAFQKLHLEAGESKVVEFAIGMDALLYFNDKEHTWLTEPGTFDAIVAASAEDIKGKVKFELQ